MSTSPRYGIDAPGVVRSLSIASGLLLLAAVTARNVVALAGLRPLAGSMTSAAIATGATAAWMLVSSLWLKQRVRDALLAERRWRGDEQVLDVGCGRGLFAIGAAIRVPAGMVTGVDRWLAKDLSGNHAAAIRANAAAADVADRLDVVTGDACALPFADARFDIVGSMTVLHNIPDAAGRAAAVAEIWRVTRPGGQILIFDIVHARSYARQFRALGAAEVRLRGPLLLWAMPGWRFSAIKPR